MISIKCTTVFVIVFIIAGINLSASRLIELEQLSDESIDETENAIDEVHVQVKNINKFLLQNPNTELIPMEMNTSVRGRLNYALGARLPGINIYIFISYNIMDISHIEFCLYYTQRK